MTRRDALSLSISILTPAGLWAKTEFWNAKTPDKWSGEEIEKLTSDSPWAKGVNVEFQQDTDPLVSAANAPTVGRAGQINAPRSLGNQMELNPDAPQIRGGARKREPVTVRWESALPIRDALGYPLPSGLDDRYVIAVTSLPYGIMDKPRRGQGPTPPPEPLIKRQQRMRDLLQSAATLEAKDKEPAQAGVVRLAPKAATTWLFGFSKDLLTIDARDREVTFTLHTALVSLRAKFEPKTMVYRGKPAL